MFSATGGLHAAGLFTAAGELLAVREDVGRHNAVDKIVGWAVLQDKLPLAGCVLLVSGRASFELVQKAVLAGIPLLAAVSAPSSLAADLAEEAGLTLIGFLRGQSMNVYTGAGRLIGMSGGGSDSESGVRDARDPPAGGRRPRRSLTRCGWTPAPGPAGVPGPSWSGRRSPAASGGSPPRRWPPAGRRRARTARRWTASPSPHRRCALSTTAGAAARGGVRVDRHRRPDARRHGHRGGARTAAAAGGRRRGDRPRPPGAARAQTSARPARTSRRARSWCRGAAGCGPVTWPPRRRAGTRRWR